MLKYTAYGYSIFSAFQLPALIPHAASQADVEITRSPRATHPADGFSFHVPGVAHYTICAGHTIHVDALTEDDSRIALYLLGTAFGVLLHQRGLLVLHANAIATPEGALLFCADSGVGKSTLAAYFLTQGYTILCDDVCAIDATGRVLPGYPQVKLWQNSIDKLSFHAPGATPIEPGMDKFRFPLPHAQYHNTPLAVRHIFALQTGDYLHCEPITGVAKFQLLKQHTYRDYVVSTLGLSATHLQHAARLANHSPVTLLTRPTTSFCVAEMHDLILSHLTNPLNPAQGCI